MKTKLTLFFFLCVMGFAGYAQKTAADVYTMGHDTLGTHNFNLYGAINGHGDNVAYAFVYSTDSLFATSTTTTVKNSVIDTLQIVWATVNGLSANTKYFYYLTATTTNGTVNGKHMKFYSEGTQFLFDNTGADVYYSGYAELNGKVRGFQFNVDLSFEYGLTPDLGLTATSNFPALSDPNPHEFRAYPNPLTPGQLYFYRVKAAGVTDTLYTDIKAFWMGYPFTLLQAMPVTNITSSTADLHGDVQGFKVPIKINFGVDQGSFHLHTTQQYYDVTTSIISFTQTATNLQPNTYYSDGIKVWSWIGNYTSDSAFTTLTTSIVSQASQNNNIMVYPEPASNYLNVELKEALNSASTIQLFNLNGQLVKEINFPAYQQKTVIDIKELASGTYMLKMASGNVVMNKKVVVVR